jgi:hypothetical protein
MKTELAIDADGQSFKLPPDVVGWKVRRLEGRGRPDLVYDDLGRRVILPVDATATDLLRIAGPGRYRLEPVDAEGIVCPDVPVGCTGPIRARETDPSEVGREPGSEIAIGGPPVRPFAGYDDILAETVRANTRLAELVIARFPAMLTAGAELITAADGARITTRQPPPMLPPPQPPEPPWDDDDTPDPSWINTLIAQVVPMVVPMILAKLPNLLPGMPLAALLDWRKASPGASSPAASSPSPASPSSVSPSPASPNPAPVVASARPSQPATPAAAAASIASGAAPHRAGERTATSAPATPTTPTAPTNEARQVQPGDHSNGGGGRGDEEGAAGSELAVLATAPAATEPAEAPPTEPSASAEIGAALQMHLMQIWTSLSPPERSRAEQLVALLTPDERAAWLHELAGMTVADAIARVRDVIRPHTTNGQTAGTT